MIEIDASFGYGQVLRTAIALASLLGQKIRIYNIRKNRPNPGLRPQHFTGIKVMAEFTKAKVSGLRIGSMDILFEPREISVESKRIDIGTAGSIPLLLQTMLPLLIFGNEEVEIEIRGGTAGLGSPTIEYISHVFLPIVSAMNVKASIEVFNQGYYPRGGGLIRLVVKPVNKLRNLEVLERGKLEKIKLISNTGSLPANKLKEQTKGVLDYLKNNGIESVEVEERTYKTLSPGSSLLLYAKFENTTLGSDNYMQKNKTLYQIGQETAEYFVHVLNSKATLDKFMADQIIPYFALAEGKSKAIIHEITDHVESNIKIVKMLTNAEIKLDGNLLEVEGIGYKK